MDRITQLQDGIDSLVTIMYSTISFLTRKADFKQVNPDIPITQTIPRPEGAKLSHETFSENCAELAQDFLKKAKQIEYLISILPPHSEDNPDCKDETQATSGKESSKKASDSIISQLPAQSDDQVPQLELSNQETGNINQSHSKDLDDDDSAEFDKLQADMQAAQHEYEQALLGAESLRSEIKQALNQIFDHRMKLLSTDL